MGFFKKLSSLFSSPAKPEAPTYEVVVKCHRCGEIIRARINLYNDLSIEYQEGGKPTYICRKMLMGEGRCFQRVEVELTFDADRRLLNREITGGQYVDA
ncbi:MAG: hypothetical protein JXB15_14920 [Anaerolineales bacterium]|nr:hypothetical protein [Anaerolineales bacterium]